MSGDGFEATFRVRIDRASAWSRLTGGLDPSPGDHLWLPGFDSQATVADVEPGSRLRATKDDQP